jgi:hypothetical protein
MNILYLIFGDEQLYHSQAYFSICSFLCRMEATDRVLIMTDAPDFYVRFNDRVQIIEVNQAQIEAWKGEYNFVFRAKIKAIEYACQLYPNEPTIYLDSDTFLFNDLKLLSKSIANPLMHTREGLMSELKSKTIRKLWQTVKGREFAGIQIQAKHAMWNAGVVGIPAGQGLKITDLVLQICDKILAEKVGKWVVEQFSFSIVMSENGNLKPVENYIGHYWSNKEEWNEAIQKFMLNSFLKGNSVQDDIKAISEFNFSKIAIQKRIPNTQIRLEKLVKKWFPSEDKAFITSKTT